MRVKEKKYKNERRNRKKEDRKKSGLSYQNNCVHLGSQDS